jgi:hypothetical protein
VLRKVMTGVIAVACAAGASSALAMSSGNLDGTVNGKTAQKDGVISPVFDVTLGMFYNASGEWRCAADIAKAYEFSSNGLARKDEPPFHFGRAFTFTVRQRWYAAGQDRYKAVHYQKGQVTVTITGTIKQVKPAPHGPRGSGLASGHGSVTFSAPGCSSGKLSWSGTGPLDYF